MGQNKKNLTFKLQSFTRYEKLIKKPEFVTKNQKVLQKIVENEPEWSLHKLEAQFLREAQNISALPYSLKNYKLMKLKATSLFPSSTQFALPIGACD